MDRRFRLSGRTETNFFTPSQRGAFSALSIFDLPLTLIREPFGNAIDNAEAPAKILAVRRNSTVAASA
jgi:hypothetical protein